MNTTTARRGRKIVAVAGLVAMTTVGLAACSGTDGDAGPGGDGDVAVALVLGLTANPFMQEVALGSGDAADALGAELTVTGPPAPNPTEGVSMLRNVVAQGVDGVTIMPLPADLWTKGFEEAAEQTNVNAINTLPVEGTKGSDTYIGNNESESATALMEYLATLIPADATGEIVLGNCIPGVASLDSRIAGYVSFIEQNLPGVEVVGPINSTTDAGENLANWKQAYFANPDALAFIGNCDTDGPSLSRMKAENPGDYLTAGFDINPATLTGIQDGNLTVAIDETPYVRGYVATAALIQEAQGGDPIVGFINVHGELITEENVAEVIERQASEDSIRAGFADVIAAFFADPAGSTGLLTLEPFENAYAGG
jgi:ABC-type sugar transport system substrate-binding protein